jgi:hypothetical protein
MLVVGVVAGGPIAFAIALEFWRKLWLQSEGVIVQADIPSKAPHGNASVKVTLHYRYSYRGIEYRKNEIRVLDVEYHEEATKLKEISENFAVGSKVAVFHPKSVPSISSLTPGGTYLPQLLLAALLVIGSMVLSHYLNKAQSL